MRKLCVFIVLLVLLLPMPVNAFMPLVSPSAVLIDQTQGTLLFAHNEHTRMYPAGLTKMLTALVALEYLDSQQVVVVGSEIYTIPYGALRSGHQVGEHITVHNLLRGLMIRNGNDSGAVLALQTVKAQRNNNNVPFVNAVQIFSEMMNSRAYYLGAKGTHFVNPNGIHHDNHYSTAYDLALIARAYMEHPLLREIAAETEFTGNGLEGFEGDLEGLEGVRTLQHHWVDTNELISGGAFHYTYATGIRSGSTPQALDALAASAERFGVNLIAVVLNSQDPDRWYDAHMLFDYGFSTYRYYEILEEGQHMGAVIVANAMLGGSDILDVVSPQSFITLLSQDQMSRLERTVIFDENFIYEEENYYGIVTLAAPIEKGEAVGNIIYTLDGRTLFEGEILAADTVKGRSLDSDMDFYIAWIWDNAFSLRALPFWMGIVGILVGVVGVSLAIAERRRSHRSWYGRR